MVQANAICSFNVDQVITNNIDFLPTDNDDFEPNLDLKPKITKGKWEGEDEDDDVKVMMHDFACEGIVKRG